MTHNTCPYCLRVMVERLEFYGNYPGRKTRDHKIPVSRGGTDHKWNIETVCASCNTVKGSMTKWEFLLFLYSGDLPFTFIKWWVTAPATCLAPLPDMEMHRRLLLQRREKNAKLVQSKNTRRNERRRTSPSSSQGAGA